MIPLSFRSDSVRNRFGFLRGLTRPVPVPLLYKSVVQNTPVYVGRLVLDIGTRIGRK